MTDLSFTRPERGGICPDCGMTLSPGEVNTHMEQHVRLQGRGRQPWFVNTLEDAGYTVSLPDQFGLVIMSGHGMLGSELTVGQLIDLAGRV